MPRDYPVGFGCLVEESCANEKSFFSQDSSHNLENVYMFGEIAQKRELIDRVPRSATALGSGLSGLKVEAELQMVKGIGVKWTWNDGESVRVKLLQVHLLTTPWRGWS